MRFVHYYCSYALYAAMAVYAILLILPGLDPYQWIGGALLCAVVVGDVISSRLHRGRLCEGCAAALPLNGAELAERYTPLFAAMHWLSDRWWCVPVVLVLVLAPVLILPGSAGVLVMLLAAAVAMWAGGQHRRLWLWCPYCRKGGRGPREETPVSPLAPTAGR